MDGTRLPNRPKRTVRSSAVRLLVARCEVLYTGRLTARLPEAVRLLMFKADGSFLVHDDAGGFRPLNWIRTDFRPDAA
jgi:RecB family endonuclease NucS